MLSPWVEGAAALSSYLAPAFCHHTPWGLVLALLLVACASGAVLGCFATLLVVSANCRRFLWCGLNGVLGPWPQAGLVLQPARRRLREYSAQ